MHPALLADSIPVVASSKTRHSWGGIPNLLQLTKYASGSGLPIFTSSPEIIISNTSDMLNFFKTKLIYSFVPEDAIANLKLFLLNSQIDSKRPGIGSNLFLTISKKILLYSL